MQTEYLTTAEEMIATLDTNLAPLNVQEMGTHVFRGQSVHLPLWPKAFRKGTELLTCDGWLKLNKDCELDDVKQVEAEFCTFKRFIEIADQQGIAIPGDDSNFRDLIDDWDSKLNNLHSVLHQWPNKELYHALGLAQHAGIPTRMLDCTYDPMIAIYFAASGVKFNNAGKVDNSCGTTTNERFVVYDIDIDGAASRETAQWINNAGAVESLTQLNVPLASNANARAQKATLILFNRLRVQPNVRTDRAPLETHLSDFIRLISLPYSEAPRCMEMLSRRFINGSSLHPGLVGCAMALEETKTWSKWCRN